MVGEMSITTRMTPSSNWECCVKPAARKTFTIRAFSNKVSAANRFNP